MTESSVNSIPAKNVNLSLKTNNLTFVGYILFICMCSIAYRFKQRKSNGNRMPIILTKFNAGGDISMSLIASTILSQNIWASEYLDSSTTGVKYGLSGPYWYATGPCVLIIIFSVISMEMKIKAPGSLTFLQIIQARFDKKTHILYIVYAIATSMIIITNILLGSVWSMTRYVDNLCFEYGLFLLTSCSFIISIVGSLGGIVYVSYFSSLFMLIFPMIVFAGVFLKSSADLTSPVGNIDNMYKSFSTIKNPADFDNSYATFTSLESFTYSIINTMSNCCTIFMSQSYWQMCTATSPKKGPIAFVIAGMAYFFIPFSCGTSISIAYMVLNSNNKTLSILESNISKDLVTPTTVGYVLGTFGDFFLNLVIIFAVTTTLATEITSMTMIVINDIIMIYVRPFKAHLVKKDSLTCLLCEKQKTKVGRNKCKCVSITNCKACAADDQKLKANNNSVRECEIHGAYRNYDNYLDSTKNFVVCIISYVIICVTIAIYSLQISLSWFTLFMGVLVGSAVFPVILSVFWSRVNSSAMFFSSVIGSIVGLISWITVTVFLYGDLNISSKNEKLTSMLVGTMVSFTCGAILVVVLTLISSKPLNVDQQREVWEKTRDIDSPLIPWSEIYAREFFKNGQDKTRPSLLEVESELRWTKRICWVLSIVFSAILLVCWPLLSIFFDVYSLTAFKFWIYIGLVALVIWFVYFLLAPLVEFFYPRLRNQLSLIKVHVIK